MSQKVVIIGGGIGGMATANLLAKNGYDVEIYEARAQLGGKMGMHEWQGFRFDTGPSWYLMPEVSEHYYKLLGTTAKEQLDLVKLKPAYKVFYEGESNPTIIYGDEAKDARSFEAREPGAAKALKQYLDSAEKVYKLALKHFLYTNFDNPRNFLKPEIVLNGLGMVRRSLSSIDGFVKKHFKNTQLQQLLEYPAVFLGSSPFSAPSLYHLMSYLDFRQGVFYPSGGMYSITESMERLGKELGVKFKTKHAVKKILIKNGVACGVELTSGRKIEADIVISNADMHFTQTKLLSRTHQDYPKEYWNKREAGPSALLMYLGVKGSLPELDHHNLFFVRAWKENFAAIFDSKTYPDTASLYVCKPSQTDGSVAPKGHENIFVLVPMAANTKQAPKDLNALADTYIRQFASQAGIKDFEKRIVYKRLFGPKDFQDEYNAWNGTALGLSHRLSQSALFRPRVKSKKVQNLYYVGANVQPGIGVPMCLISAELVYKNLIQDRSSGPLKEPN